jgi:hypothetical protein
MIASTANGARSVRCAADVIAHARGRGPTSRQGSDSPNANSVSRAHGPTSALDDVDWRSPRGRPLSLYLTFMPTPFDQAVDLRLWVVFVLIGEDTRQPTATGPAASGGQSCAVGHRARGLGREVGHGELLDRGGEVTQTGGRVRDAARASSFPLRLRRPRSR